MTSTLMPYAAVAVAFALSASLPHAVQAKTLRVASPNDIPSLDPMFAGAAFPLGAQGWFYETLTGYDKDLKLTPVLAQNWENPEPTKWVFHLRQGVRFHDGSPFTADDVIFSWQRGAGAASDASPGLKAADITKLDDYTIEVTTPAPNPILPRAWAELHIMSKTWAERNKASSTSKAPGGGSAYASLHENGTGPFMVVDHQPGVQTSFKRYDGYWDARMPTDVTDIIFRPIAKAPTRMAALQRGEVDLAAPVSMEDWRRAGQTPDIRIWAAHQAEVLFIGMDQHHDELPFSSLTDKNPFKDKRVRQAVSLAIDTGAINQAIMHGMAVPTGTLISSQINGYDRSFATPYPNDPDKSRKLLADAGYTNGFSVGLDCPSGRNPQDAEICAAIADMLARVGITVQLPLQEAAGSAAQPLPPAGGHSGMYLMRWTPRYMDAAAALSSLVTCREGPASGGQYLGGYCNREIDALTAKIDVEIDPIRRNAMIKEAFGILHNDYGYLPLHQPPMLWGARPGIELHQRPDGVLDVRVVVVIKGDRP